jgi:hypothetical protein
MITVTEVINSADMGAQAFTVLRTQGTGAFQLGGYRKTTFPIPMYGTLQPATPEDLKMIAEGDRVTGMISIWTSAQIYHTNPNGTSDVVIWNNEKYRVMSVNPWFQGGMWHSVCARLSGE